jgi:hypothetical protein
MAGSKANFLENKLLEHVFKTNYDADTALATIKVALFLNSDKPTDSNPGTEVSTVGTAYVRQSITRSSGWTLATNTITNVDDITWAQATADYGEVGAFALFDAAGTNMLYWGDLTTPKTISTGDTAKISAGDIDIAED